MRKAIVHPTLNRVFDVYQDKRNYYIVTDYCKGDLLFDRLKLRKDLTEAEVAKIMKVLLQAVFYGHTKGFSHRQLKPSNIRYLTKEPDSPLQILDFGLHTIKTQPTLYKKIPSTYKYMAPESFEGLGSKPADIWSCGVILFLLLSGRFPFTGDS